MKHTLPVLLALTLLVAPISGISGILVNEATAGDFHAGQIFILSEGSNVFAGSQVWDDDPVDGFRFVIPDGLHGVIDVNHEITNLGAAEGAAWIWDLTILLNADSCTPLAGSPRDCIVNFGDHGGFLTSEIFQSPEDYLNPAGWDFDPISTFILGAGVYQLSDNFTFKDAVNKPVLRYSVNIDLVAVSEPPLFLLVGAGIALVIKRGRRQLGPVRS